MATSELSSTHYRGFMLTDACTEGFTITEKAKVASEVGALQWYKRQGNASLSPWIVTKRCSLQPWAAASAVRLYPAARHQDTQPEWQMTKGCWRYSADCNQAWAPTHGWSWLAWFLCWACSPALLQPTWWLQYAVRRNHRCCERWFGLSSPSRASLQHQNKFIHISKWNIISSVRIVWSENEL